MDIERMWKKRRT